MQSFPVCVDSTHASWLLAGNVFTPGNSGVEHARAVAGARRLGYDLYVSSVALPEIVESDTLSFAIKIRNMGVAPFYYRWAVQLRLVNDARIETQTWDTPWDLTTLVDTSEMEFSCPRRLDGLTPGYYTLLMRAADPLPGGKPLAFANTNWGRDVPGWLSLGGFTFASTTGNARGDDNGPPNNFKLEQNFPNPFNPATKIRFVIGVRGDGHRAMGNRWVRLVIYDVLGRTVAVLVDEAKEPGNFEVQFDGSRLAGGVYVCRMQAGDYVASRKILLLR